MAAESQGYIEIYYSGSTKYYTQFQTDPLTPVKLLDGTTEMGSKAWADVHSSLLAFHKKQLNDAGISPASLVTPTSMTVSNWVADHPTTPGIGRMSSATDENRAVARAPTKAHDVYVADQDYGYRAGWAVGSLKMAEKVLQAQIGLAKPAWLDQTWYMQNVVDLQDSQHDRSLFNGGANSDIPKAEL